MVERRHAQRWQIGQKTNLKLQDQDIPFVCTIDNIGLQGMKIRSAEELNTNKGMRINVPLSPGFSLNNVEAVISWSNVSQNGNIYGLRFAKMRDADKETIFRFIQKYFHTQLCGQWWKDWGK